MTEKNLELAPLPAARRRQLYKLAEKLGVEFGNIELLHVALTHKSYAKKIEEDTATETTPGKKIAHNERLEFLGDAVLELASSTYLFNKFYNRAGICLYAD